MRALLLVFAFAFAAHADQITLTNNNPGVGPISIIGDSLAAGYGADQEDAKPAGCFRGNFQGEVSDFSVPGRTSTDILNDLEKPLQKAPHMIFVSAGGNDAIQNYYTGNFPNEKSYDQMTQLFDRLVATGALVVYLGLNPPYEGAERLPGITAIAQAKGILVVDGMNGFWGTQKMSDEFHPTTEGYREMCQRIVDSVRGHYP
jgi:lysophospholipase L1-like esterase